MYGREKGTIRTVTVKGCVLEFSCLHGSGFSPDVVALDGVVRARKRVLLVVVEFARCTREVYTLEGPAEAAIGDAIVTGVKGERWPISRHRFTLKYEPVPPVILYQDGRYRTRPVEVLAVAMRQGFSVVLGDGTSRLTGQPSDWLVDYGDGSLGVVAKDVFASTYEVLADGESGALVQST